MSTQAKESSGGEGLSVKTLVVASISSLVAALVVHTFWKGGAILGAAITPVIVALTKEVLERPKTVVTAVVPRRPRRPGDPPVAADAPATRPREDDRFGIWQAERPSAWDRVKGRPLKIALATGALAFVIGAFVLTGADLVFGGSVGGGGGDRFTLVPGETKDANTSDDDNDGTMTTETAPRTETDDENVIPPPAETEPAETVPEPTTETAPPTDEVPPVIPAPEGEGGTEAPAPDPAE